MCRGGDRQYAAHLLARGALRSGTFASRVALACSGPPRLGAARQPRPGPRASACRACPIPPPGGAARH
eukprot:2202629-Pyramimonas_sp.AAC.1